MNQELQVALSIIAAAGLGATFAALFDLSTSLSDRTFKIGEEYAYISRILLGLVAGVILAVLIPVEELGGPESFTAPLLALLGGFSSPLVRRVLQQLVSAVEALFTGDPEARMQTEVAAAATRAELAAMSTNSTVIARLAEVEGVLAGGGTTKNAIAMIRDIRRLLTEE